MPGVAGEQVFGQYPHALLLPGEVPQRLGEHQQSVQRHMGSRYTGSGKTFSIIEPFIRQHSAKGFALVVYDYKFPTLATKLYYHYKKNQKLGKLPKGCKFNIINFVDVEYSRRVNPIQLKYINNLAAASETAETLLESLQKGKKEGGGGSDQFFQTSAVNFLAACIYFFCNWGKEPYDKDGNMLTAEKVQDKQTKRMIPTGRVFNSAGEEVEPAYWLGKYSDCHISCHSSMRVTRPFSRC